MKLNTTIRIGDRDALYCIRRWCMECEHHVDEDELTCPISSCDANLRRRRMYVCRERLLPDDDKCEQGYFSRDAFLEHECGSVY